MQNRCIFFVKLKTIITHLTVLFRFITCILLKKEKDFKLYLEVKGSLSVDPGNFDADGVQNLHVCWYIHKISISFKKMALKLHLKFFLNTPRTLTGKCETFFYFCFGSLTANTFNEN